MALSLSGLRFLSKRGTEAPLKRSRTFKTSSSSKEGVKRGKVIGAWKGFGEPSWSVEAKFLSQTGSQKESRVSPVDVTRIANLSYLKIAPEKAEALTRDMDNILKSMASMDEVDTTNVEPLLSILEDFQLKTRPDKARATTRNSDDGPSAKAIANENAGGEASTEEWGYVETPDPKILDNASHKEMGFFVVPKQKQPWEEEEQPDLDAPDVAALRAIQRELKETKL